MFTNTYSMRPFVGSASQRRKSQMLWTLNGGKTSSYSVKKISVLRIVFGLSLAGKILF